MRGRLKIITFKVSNCVRARLEAFSVSFIINTAQGSITKTTRPSGATFAETPGAGTPDGWSSVEPKTMTANESAAEKRVVTKLNFGPKTAKRVTWEAWEFTVVGPHQVQVTNAAYGTEKSAHSYVAGVEQQDGVVVSIECECPSDVHREEGCKHKVALATVGGQTVLWAATAHESPSATSSSNDTARMTAAEVLQTDGGTASVDADRSGTNPCLGDTEWCPGPVSNSLPCFSCYRGENR